MERIKDFFSNIDVSIAIKALNITRKSKYDPSAIIRYFMFEKLGDFKSTAQTLRFVKDNGPLAELQGFSSEIIPNQATLNYFTKKYGTVSQILRPLVDQVIKFFYNSDMVPDENDMDLFLVFLRIYWQEQIPMQRSGIASLKKYLYRL
ncbi:MAG: hypothetical protein ACTSRP_17035 [Candidatus Helarchaeota archaeon]